MYEKEKDISNSLHHFLIAVQLNPDYVVAHTNLGGLLADMGDYVTAREHLKKALILDPNFKPALLNLHRLPKEKIPNGKPNKTTLFSYITNMLKKTQ